MGLKNFKWLTALRIVAPIVLAFVPQVPKALIPVIVAGIEQAEETGLTGSDKKTLVIGRIEQTMAEPGVHSDVAKAIDAVITATNKLEPHVTEPVQ